MQRRLSVLAAAAAALALHGRSGIGLHGLCLQREGQHDHRRRLDHDGGRQDRSTVGQRPRGITISHDGKFIYLCASDDDTIEVIDTATLQIVGTLPSGPDPELFVLSPDGKTLYVANEDDNLVTVIDVESKKVLAEIPVGVEPEGMGDQSRRQDHGQHLRDDQHGAFHRHHHARDHRQCAGRFAPALRRVQAGRLARCG